MKFEKIFMGFCLSSGVGFLAFSGLAQNIGIGNNNPDYKLTIASSHVLSNNNTSVLGLRARNPVFGFNDENNVGYGYLKAWTNAPYAPFTNGLVIGSHPGYPIFLSTNYAATMTVADNGNVGIGTTTPDFSLTVASSFVQTNNNTHLLRLKGRNPTVTFTDEFDNAYGYMKSWTNAPYAPFTNGLVIGSIPGYPIYFSTNYGATMTIANNGNVGIGTTTPTYKLAVNGNIRSKEVVVESNWADYVFDKNYQRPSLLQLDEYITRHKHLPKIPSAKEIEANGLHVGDMQKKMMEKIEELTLYVIELKKEIDVLNFQKNHCQCRLANNTAKCKVLN